MDGSIWRACAFIWFPRGFVTAELKTKTEAEGEDELFIIKYQIPAPLFGLSQQLWG